MLAGPVDRVVDHPCINHRSLDMTRQYARISNRVVADEYAAVTAKVEALYKTVLPADAEGPNMKRLRSEVECRDVSGQPGYAASVAWWCWNASNGVR